MKKDQVFKQRKGPGLFSFDRNVAIAFDDMVARSIPFYHEIHRLILDLSRYLVKNEAVIYDLGCSTGETILILDQYLKKNRIKAHFIGIDNSLPMLAMAHKKLVAGKVRSFELIHADLTKYKMKRCDLVIMNYTLQFIPLRKRQKLLKEISQALRKGGGLVMSEKIASESTATHNLLNELYYDFKRRNGYSELEIANKREALEKVLVPVTAEKQLRLMRSSGFKKSEMIFRWYNFSSYLGLK
jgi:tRNA (cmo5U34)-methyltransferase